MSPWRIHLVIIAPIIALFVLHAMATYWHWYFFFIGFDSPMHLFGGAAAGWAVAHLCWYADVRLTISNRDIVVAPLLFAVLAAAIVGVGWEWYEFFKDLLFATTDQPSVADTMKDLALDVLGGILGGLVAYDARSTT